MMSTTPCSKTNAIFLSILAMMLSTSRADYVLYQTFASYLNPLHNTANGRCCDSQDSPPCPEPSSCDNIFTVCAQNSGQVLDDEMNIRLEDCPLGYFMRQQPLFENDNITFNTSLPLEFTGDIWPGSFQLIVQVYDDDTGNPDDFVDILFIEEFLSPSSSIPLTIYTSEASVFSLLLGLRVECEENYYGDGCDILCQSQDDVELGHYTCGSEGQRVCSDGYRPPECVVKSQTCTTCGANSTLNNNCSVLNCTNPECTTKCETVEDDGDSLVAAVVSVVVILAVLAAVAIALIVVLAVKRKYIFSGNNVTKGLMPGDNPVYMSSADLNTTTSSSLHSPSHCSATPLSHPTDNTTLDEVTGEDHEEQPVVDDSVCGSSINPHSPLHSKLDPYGNYGNKTITRVAGFAPSPELFDDSKYAEWSPPMDSDDVNSDCQSEYL